MIKKLIYLILIAGILINTCSCTLLQKSLDKRTGFSDVLKQTEKYIRGDDWVNAKTSLENSKKTWKKLKPMLQVDIDHDYVNSIENEFVKLSGYIDTEEKPDSLATILLIQATWEDIGVL